MIALLDSPHTWQETDSIAGAATETMRQSHQLRATEWAMLLHGHQHHAGKTKRMAMQRAKAPRALPQQPGKCYLQLLLWKAEKVRACTMRRKTDSMATQRAEAPRTLPSA